MYILDNILQVPVLNHALNISCLKHLILINHKAVIHFLSFPQESEWRVPRKEDKPVPVWDGHHGEGPAGDCGPAGGLSGQTVRWPITWLGLQAFLASCHLQPDDRTTSVCVLLPTQRGQVCSQCVPRLGLEVFLASCHLQPDDRTTTVCVLLPTQRGQVCSQCVPRLGLEAFLASCHLQPDDQTTTVCVLLPTQRGQVCSQCVPRLGLEAFLVSCHLQPNYHSLCPTSNTERPGM